MEENIINPGIGMPTALYLHEFGSQIWNYFGKPPYHVGSSLLSKTWRDVDVRLILEDEVYESMGFGNPVTSHQNAEWVSLCMAYSALGKQMTGLPIDFQIQQQSKANRDYPSPQHPRSALGVVPLRFRKEKFEGADIENIKNICEYLSMGFTMVM